MVIEFYLYMIEYDCTTNFSLRMKSKSKKDNEILLWMYVYRVYFIDDREKIANRNVPGSKLEADIPRLKIGSRHSQAQNWKQTLF
jgi:hypothetical protein